MSGTGYEACETPVDERGRCLAFSAPSEALDLLNVTGNRISSKPKEIQGWINGNASTHVIWLICRPPPWRWPHQCHLRRLLDWVSAWWEKAVAGSAALAARAEWLHRCVYQGTPLLFLALSRSGADLDPGQTHPRSNAFHPLRERLRAINFFHSQLRPKSNARRASSRMLGATVQSIWNRTGSVCPPSTPPSGSMSWTPVRKVGTGDDSSRFGAPRKPFSDH
jgi:hypothetical protein